VANAQDPEGGTVTYFFQVDRSPSFGSPDLQTSPEVPEGTRETAWTPVVALEDNTVYYWRAAASDGNTLGPWSSVERGRFFMNLANDPPGAPVLLDPVDGRIVTTATPPLLLRNAVDPDGDPLTYDFVVTDASSNPVQQTSGVPAGLLETSWTLPTPL